METVNTLRSRLRFDSLEHVTTPDGSGRVAVRLEWEGDTNLIRNYKIPEAQRFTRTFCNTCGGAVPRLIPEMGLAFVPAGTLNEEPNIKPQARIFQDSKAGWSCSTEELPLFDTYPQ